MPSRRKRKRLRRVAVTPPGDRRGDRTKAHYRGKGDLLLLDWAEASYSDLVMLRHAVHAGWLGQAKGTAIFDALLNPLPEPRTHKETSRFFVLANLVLMIIGMDQKKQWEEIRARRRAAASAPVQDRREGGKS